MIAKVGLFYVSVIVQVHFSYGLVYSFLFEIYMNHDVV
jgi:hypothetical protein